MWSEQLTTGHPGARADLTAAWKAGRLPHALLLTGEAGIGKAELARWIVCLRWCRTATGPCGRCPSCKKVLTGNHPDLQILRRDPPAEFDPKGWGSRTGITVDQIREGLIPSLALAAIEGGGRSVIVRAAEDLNEQAQNALLKTLEEPPRDALLILVTAREESLLDTIRSRCQELRLLPLSAADMAALASDHDPRLLALARGRPARLKTLRALDLDALLVAVDGLLLRPVNGTAFGVLLGELVERALEADPELEEQDVRQQLLEVLQARIRDLALVAGGAGEPIGRGTEGEPGGLLTGQFPESLRIPAIEVLNRLQDAIFEADLDLRRHLPASVAWAALGCEFVTELVGGVVDAGRYP